MFLQPSLPVGTMDENVPVSKAQVGSGAGERSQTRLRPQRSSRSSRETRGPDALAPFAYSIVYPSLSSQGSLSRHVRQRAKRHHNSSARALTSAAYRQTIGSESSGRDGVGSARRPTVRMTIPEAAAPSRISSMPAAV